MVREPHKCQLAATPKVVRTVTIKIKRRRA